MVKSKAERIAELQAEVDRLQEEEDTPHPNGMMPSSIIYTLLGKAGWSQMRLATQLGYSTQSAVSNRLHQKSMTVVSFNKMLSAFGYEIVVRPRGSTDPADEMKVR